MRTRPAHIIPLGKRDLAIYYASRFKPVVPIETDPVMSAWERLQERLERLAGRERALAAHHRDERRHVRGVKQATRRERRRGPVFEPYRGEQHGNPESIHASA